MSYVSGLLHRELGLADSASPTTYASVPSQVSVPSQGTAAGHAVVPRLASRFEEPGAPRWPGLGGEAAEGSGVFSGVGQRAVGVDLSTRAPRTLPEKTDDQNLVLPRAAPGRNGAEPDSLAGQPRVSGPGESGPPTVPTPHSSVPGPDSRWHQGAAQGLELPAPPAPGVRPQLPDGPATAGAAAAEARAAAGPAAGRTAHPAVRTGVVPSPVQAAAWGRTLPRQDTAPDGGAVRPRLEPLPRPEPARAEPAHIHVSIGRIEVRAVTAAPARVPAPAAETGLTSLDDYLRGRP